MYRRPVARALATRGAGRKFPNTEPVMNRTTIPFHLPNPKRRLRVLAAVLLLAWQGVASAGVLLVTRTDDPAPNGCLPADCSLREALDSAGNIIQVPVGNYTLTRGALVMSTSNQVYGQTDGGVTQIDGDGVAPVFDLRGAIDVKLARLNIRGHGKHAIDAEADTNVILEYVTIPDSGSPIFAGDSYNSLGSLDIRASEIHAYVDCGRINFCRILDSALLRLQVGSGEQAQTRLVIEQSTIDGDLSPDSDSGLVIQTNNDVSIIDSAIEHTNIGLDIPAAMPAFVLLDHVTYLANEAPIQVRVPTDVMVFDSEFRANVSAPGAGPAAIVAAGASTWDIERSSFIGNTGDTSVGGAMRVEEGAHVAIRNSTFSSNSFSVASAAGARGAAIGFRSDAAGTSLLLQHVTIAAPAVFPAGILGTALGGEGGETGLVLTVRNSILRGSCSLDANAMDSNAGNIESAGDTCDFDADNQVGVSSSSLALGTLADHGGATPTYVPGANSPAVDGADPAYCLDTDQRGYQRPFGDGCDVGAVERGAEDRVFANGFD
jgi:hypothetical protein